MGIIGKVGRKSLRVRSLNTGIHIALILGGITMIYPFLIMISASFKGKVDSVRLDLVPQYFYSEEMLFKKYIESRFNEEISLFSAQYKHMFYAVDYLKIPEKLNENFVSDWNGFINLNEDKYDEFDFAVSEQFSRGVYTYNERAFREKMSDEVDGDLSALNAKYGISAPAWEDVREESKEILTRSFTSDRSGMLVPYDRFRKELHPRHKIWLSADGHYISRELFTAFKGDLSALNDSLGTSYASWDNIVLSSTIPDGPEAEYWTHYVKKTLNVHRIGLNNAGFEKFRSFLKDKYPGISLLNGVWESKFADYGEIGISEARLNGAPLLDYIFFIENMSDPADIILSGIEFDYRDFLKEKYSGIDELNRAYHNGYATFADVTLPETEPENNVVENHDRIEFIETLDPSLLRLSHSAQFDYIEFLKEKYVTLDLEKINRELGTDFDSEINIYPPSEIPVNNNHAKLWKEFIMKIGRFVIIDKSAAPEWKRFLENKYVDIASLNRQYGLLFPSFGRARIDFVQLDYDIFKKYKSEIFKEQLTRNYIMVLDEMLNNGRAIMNTLIYCLLAILTAVIVNPLAAYAMSRFRLKSNYKIILVLMLTMAFPPMVMGIPNFLILKNLNLLNTFWALILPGAADGYFIFLLKGFFDSLPKELFESATVDGAGEVTIFTRIAMSLSKPIMAVIALGAFNGAYRNFMFAFIVCQDQSMWTMMVHIYQLMQRSSAGVGYAALVIAAIPTFAVFIFFQNIIIKGIVVPTEK